MEDRLEPAGGLGAKFERAFVSEIVGIDAVRGVKTSSRIDPLGVQLAAGPLYQSKEGGWTLDPDAAVRRLRLAPGDSVRRWIPSFPSPGIREPALRGARETCR